MRWTEEEKDLLMQAHKIHDCNYEKIREALGSSRSTSAIRKMIIQLNYEQGNIQPN